MICGFVGARLVAPAVLAAWLQHEGMHSAPQSFVEYILVGIAAVILVWTLVKATQWTIRPGEHNADHIKRTILDDEFVEPGAMRHEPEPPRETLPKR